MHSPNTESNNQATTTTTYEYRSTSPTPGQNTYEYQVNNTNNTQTNNYEYSRTVGNPGVTYEHTISHNNTGGNYLTPGGNSRGPGDFGTTNYEYSRTIGSPGQTYEFTSHHNNYEKARKSAAPTTNYERTSAHQTTTTYNYDNPNVNFEARILHKDNDPIMTRSYVEERTVKSKPPAKESRKKSEDEADGPNYDFNQKNDLVDLMAEEHRQLRGTLPVVAPTVTTKDLLLADYKPASEDFTARKTAEQILKEYPITTHTQVEVAKKSAPLHVTASVTEPTADHHLHEWSRKKYLKELIDHDEEVEETRLDYCGLCVSKRRGRRPKY